MARNGDIAIRGAAGILQEQSVANPMAVDSATVMCPLGGELYSNAGTMAGVATAMDGVTTGAGSG
jgi:hypothetical protein